MGQQKEMYDRPQTRPNISSPAQLNPTKWAAFTASPPCAAIYKLPLPRAPLSKPYSCRRRRFRLLASPAAAAAGSSDQLQPWWVITRWNPSCLPDPARPYDSLED
jgi:hypothetical protein